MTRNSQTEADGPGRGQKARPDILGVSWVQEPRRMGLRPPDGLSASPTAFTSRLSLPGLTFHEPNFTLRLLCSGSTSRFSNTGFVLTLGNDFNIAGIKIPRRAQRLGFRSYRDPTRSRSGRCWFRARSVRGRAGHALPGAPGCHSRFSHEGLRPRANRAAYA